MANARLTRQFPEGQRVDPALTKHRLRLLKQHGTEIAVMEGATLHDPILPTLDSAYILGTV